MMRIGYGPRLLVAAFLTSTMAFAATVRQWLTGKLVDSERQTITNGSTTTYNTDSEAKHKNGKTSYSRNTTAHTTDGTDNYEVYTIESPGKTYIAREKLNFPWPKPANVTVGARSSTPSMVASSSSLTKKIRNTKPQSSKPLSTIQTRRRARFLPFGSSEEDGSAGCSMHYGTPTWPNTAELVVVISLYARPHVATTSRDPARPSCRSRA